MRRRKTIVLIITVLAVSLLGIAVVNAEEDEVRPRVAVLDLRILDHKGEIIDSTQTNQADLVGLSRVMASGIASRLVQYQGFEITDTPTLRAQELATFSGNYSPYEQANMLLQTNAFDQVITGTISLLQTSVVIAVQRYEYDDDQDQPRLVGSAMAQGAKISDAPALVDSLVSGLFSADVQVIERSIEQVFLVPGQLRVNLGSSHQINAYALDNLGRPVGTPDFLFFSSDESKVSVDEWGVIRGLQPGTATITARAISKTARSGPPTTMTVTVVPPALGVRFGTVLTQRDDMLDRPIRFGLRLTPTFDQGSQKSSSNQPAVPTTSDVSNPLTFVSTFFSSLLTNGLITIDLDFEPTKEIVVAFNGVQRSAGGYIGTGVGYVTPMDGSGDQGFTFRFTLGTQARPNSRLSLPGEVVLDMMFPTSQASKPTFRLGINFGLDLFP